MVKIEIVNNCFLRRTGGQDKPKILCLAGFADNGEMFKLLFTSVLARNFEVIAVDLPGFGASPRQPEIDTIEKYGKLVSELAQAVSPQRPVGLVGHSIASAIAVAAARHALSAISGVFSIEGNLTQDDAYFSGQAVDWDDPFGFQQHFLNKIWSNSQSQPILRRYFAAAMIADPVAMWELGNDANKISVADAVGKAYLSLPCPSLYYWSKDNTPEKTQEFIASTGLENLEFTNASHWPTVDAAKNTADAIRTFFNDLPE